MKFKLNEVYNLSRSLPNVTNKELPINTSFRLLSLLKKCSEEIKILEESRIKLVKKYAEKGKEEGKEGEFKVAEENAEKFQKEFEALLSEEVKIDFKKIKIADMGDITISVNDLMFLEKIIDQK